MKKLFMIGILVVTAIAIIGCQGRNGIETAAPPPAEERAPAVMESAPQPAGTAAYADGVYFAVGDSFSRSGWKYTVSFEIQDGKFIWADWNAVHRNSGPDKKTFDQLGGYQMVARGGAIDEWYVQAQKTEAHLIETQNPAVTYTSDSGHTDDITGVTIYVSQFYTLIEKALAAGPVGRGPYEDGLYFAAAEDFSGNWKSTVALNVINGYIAGVNWSAADRNGRDKKTVDRDGGYQMVARGGAIDEWHIQAARVENLLLETQDPAIPYDEGGYTDAVSSVTIHIDDFVVLTQAALDNGPIEPVLYSNGIFYAEADDFSGNWKSTIEVMIVNGFISHVNWSAVDKDGRDKKTVDLEGGYQMVARGGAIDEWHVQAARVEQDFIRRQNAGIPHDDGGYTDAVSSVTIRINDFVELAGKALQEARR